MQFCLGKILTPVFTVQNAHTSHPTLSLGDVTSPMIPFAPSVLPPTNALGELVMDHGLAVTLHNNAFERLRVLE